MHSSTPIEIPDCSLVNGSLSVWIGSIWLVMRVYCLDFLVRLKRAYVLVGPEPTLVEESLIDQQIY